MDREKNYKRNIFWGILSKILMILLPFIVRSLIIYKLGIDYVGLNTLFSTILQVLNLAEMGFSSSLIFCMYKPIAENNKKEVSALLNYYKYIYKKVGLLILIFGIAIMPFLKYLISGTVPNDVNLYILYFIYLINTALSYMIWSYRSSVMIANQRVDQKTKTELLFNSLMNIFQIISLFLFSNYYCYIILLPIFTLVMNFSLYNKCKKIYPDINPEGCISDYTKLRINEQVRNIMWHKIGNTIIFSFDSIIISAFLGLKMLGIYNNYYYIYTAVASLFSIFYESIIPGIGNSIILENKEKNYSDFLYFSTINFMMISICSNFLVCLYQPFMKLWQGENLLLNSSIPILLVFQFMVWHSRRIIHTYKDSAGLWKNDKYRPIAEAFFNLILNIIMVKHYGLVGVILSTILSMILLGIPWENYIFIKKYFNKKQKSYYLYSIKNLIIIVFNLTLCYIICSYIPSINILYFILKIFVCTLVSIIMILVEYRKINIIKKIKLIRRKNV